MKIEQKKKELNAIKKFLRLLLKDIFNYITKLSKSQVEATK